MIHLPPPASRGGDAAEGEGVSRVPRMSAEPQHGPPTPPAHAQPSRDGQPSPAASGRPRPLVGVLTTERPRPRRIRTRPDAWWLAVGTVCFGAFMGQLDASVVTLTYGSLRAQFHTSLAAVQWVSLGYLLALIALLIPIGRISDARGRKLTYLYGFAVFTLASAACGLAPSLPALIGFRVAQAIGAAMLQANSVALVSTVAPPGRMRSALGVQAAAQALGLALGPTVGGIMVSTIGWRWVFGVNVPVGLVALLAGHYLLPRTRHRTRLARLDLPGVGLLAIATTAALLGVSVLSGLRAPAWSAAALLAVAAAAGWAFVRRQRRTEHPLLNLGLLRARAVSVGLAGAMFGYLILFGPLALVPVTLGDAGSTPLTAGLTLTALPAGLTLAATLADRALPARWTDRTRCAVGAAVSVLALALLAVAGMSVLSTALLLALLGLGLGMFAPANNAQIMTAVPVGAAGAGGSLVSMARAIGTAGGIAAVTLSLHLSAETAGADPRPALLMLTGGAALTLGFALLGKRADGMSANAAGPTGTSRSGPRADELTRGQ